MPVKKGYKFSEERNLKISASKKGVKRPDISGENHHLYGKTHTPEAKKKISESRKGKPAWNSGKKGLQTAWNKGIRLTKEQRKNMGKSNHWNWKGGVTEPNKRERKSVEYTIWRTSVFERDNYKCVQCGATGVYLEADHIKPFSTHRYLRYEVSNGRTLCKPCHRKTDTYGVRKRSKKIALIFGVTGMDGSYLAEFLLDNGYTVHAMLRRSSTFNRQRIEHLRGKIHYHYGDVTDPFSIMWIIKKSKPQEIYNLSAQSHVQVSWETPWLTAQITGVGVLNILESVRVLGMEKKVRIYQASTSELFSGLDGGKQNEETIKNPASPYGTAKLYGFQIAKNYREAYGMHISNGILFNHEGYRRGDNFVTKKICLDSKKGETHLGNLDTERDWGWAPQYVEGMWMMLQQETPDDYVLATGESHSIGEFVGWVEEETGKKLKVILDPEYARPTEVPKLCGDSSKAERVLGWKATVKGKDIAKKVLTKDL